MWKDLEKESLEELLFVLNNIIAKLEDLEEVNPVQILSSTDGFPQAFKEVKSFVSRIFKTPEFLLDMEGPKSASEILEAFQDWKKQILDHIKIQEHPDNLPELLYGQREFGCVYLSTQLLKRVHCLGEAVLEYQRTKDETASKEIEKQMLEIMIESSEWVTYTKRKWGVMPNTELAIISPLTKEDIENARPNVETDPPF